MPTPDWNALADDVRGCLQSNLDAARQGLEGLVRAARDSVDAAEAGLMVQSEDESHLRFLVSVNSHPELTTALAALEVPCDRSIAGYAFTTGQPIAIEDLSRQTDGPQHFTDVREVTKIPEREYLVVPVLQAEHVLGVLTFLNRPVSDRTSNSPAGAELLRPFSQEELRTAHGYAALAATLLQYYRRTELLNRVTLESLDDTVGTLAPPQASGTPYPPGFGREESTLARILNQLQRIPDADWEVVADVADVLAEHLRRRA